ncbi:MAG: hypothetical protein J5858_12085 [Lentisphaeria bacterium]|nr:hypothetical protein [Lentisphaeria bacterium]
MADIKEKYPQFISGSRHYPGMPWRFKRAIHVVDSTTIQLIAKCMNWAKHSQQKAAAKMLSSRRFFTLVRGVLWNQKRLSTLIASIEKEEQETSPPIRLSAVQMQFDFGNI